VERHKNGGRIRPLSYVLGGMTQNRKLPCPSLVAGLVVGLTLSTAIVQYQAVPHVVDGDTLDWGWRIVIERARYRIAGVDAPETRGAKCAEERSLGKVAAHRLRSLVAGGDVSLRVEAAHEKWGRQIASVSRGGTDVSETLIGEGLAHPYSGKGERGGWCATAASN